MKFFIISLINILFIISYANDQNFKKTRRHSWNGHSLKKHENSDNNQNVYECAGFSFVKYNDAKAFLTKIRSNSNLDIIQNPKGSLSLESPTIKRKKKDPFKKLCLESLLGTNFFSNRVWHRVWDRCDYHCFKKYDFTELAMRIVIELNLYRKYHGVGQLHYSPFLVKASRDYAKSISKIQLVYPDPNPNYRRHGQVTGKIFYKWGNMLIKKWYDRGQAYDYHLNIQTYPFQEFTQLIWGNSTEVGCGASLNGKFLYLHCKFFPKGNRRGRFYDNVISQSEMLAVGK